MKKNGKIKSQKAKGLSRRNFIRTVGAASAAFTIIPRHTLGGIGYTAPSDMLNIAGIGVGGRGISDITAICPLEVDERQVLKLPMTTQQQRQTITWPIMKKTMNLGSLRSWPIFTRSAMWMRKEHSVHLRAIPKRRSIKISGRCLKKKNR